MIGGAIFLVGRDGMKDLVPSGEGYFNWGSFLELFSNSVFALLFHHSLPGIVTQLKNTEDIHFVIRNAFLISGFVLIVLPLTACMAFG
jgi:amino acid permease